jgi:hypothetical protein
MPKPARVSGGYRIFDSTILEVERKESSGKDEIWRIHSSFERKNLTLDQGMTGIHRITRIGNTVTLFPTRAGPREKGHALRCTQPQPIK